MQDLWQDRIEYPELWEHINHLEIYDTHEHLSPNKAYYRSIKKDILIEVMCTYVQSDLVLAGASQDVINNCLDADEDLILRWKMIEKFWPSIANTGYGRMVRIGCRDIFGEEINANSVQSVNEKFEDLLATDFYKEILSNKSKIRLCLLDKYQPFQSGTTQISVIDSCEDVETEHFKCVYRLDHFVFPKDWQDVNYFESQSGIRIRSLDDWCEACSRALDNAIEKGVAGFKTALAYNRSLDYQFVTKSKAEKAFNKFLTSKRDMNWEKQSVHLNTDFQNYMMHFILRILDTRQIPIQFHTGIQAGNGNYLENADPLLLTHLFMNYPKINFVLLHTGFPFHQQAAALAKMFPNVYLDMSWIHVVSPETAVRSLGEWIHLLPSNKITAFGGDLPSVVCVYGHQKMARWNIYRALAEKVSERSLDVEDAKKFADRWLVNNTKNLYQIES